MRQLLSVGKYEKFRKCLNDVYSSFDKFYNQFIEVLRVRLNKQDINTVKNPRLAMYNLYSAAKTLVDFQEEYDLLFSNYSSLGDNFAKYELENVLTLVNIWCHVLNNQPKGYAIAYDAKQKYRKGTNYFEDTLSKAVTAVNGTLFKGEKYAYILADYKWMIVIHLKMNIPELLWELGRYLGIVFCSQVIDGTRKYNHWNLRTSQLFLVYILL